MRNYFNIALGLSISIHIIILGGVPINLPIFRNQSLPQPKTEFIPVKKELPKRNLQIVKESSLKEPPPYLDLQKQLLNLKKARKTALKKPSINNTILNTKEVVFIKSREELDAYPAYVNYYERIRERIRKEAYRNFKFNVSGRIVLTFTVNNRGQLIIMNLDDKNSSHSSILRKIAQWSIKNSSPFPKFPNELKKFKTLTFNLSIHFKSN